MPSALEDYMMRMGYGSSVTGSLGITPPPAPDLVVPKFTSIGDRMAAIGGFGDQPGELKTVEQLRRMSQQKIDEYERLRKSARNRGIAESLIAIGQAFEGKTPSSLGTKQTFERFGVYDALGNPIGSVSKQDLAKITEIESDPTKFLGPLAAPSIGTKQQPTEFERLQSRYLDLSSKQNLTETQKLELRTLESKIFGTDLIPFFNEDGLQVTTITQTQLATDPDIVNRLEEEGLFSVGAKSAFATKGVKSPLSDMAENYLDEKSQLNAINDLATIIYQDRDAFSLAGSLAGLVNTGRYQLESAARLAKLNDFAQLNPTEYAKYNERIDGLLDNQYGKILDQISQDRAVAKSIFLKLAYAIAKDIDPSGRLSDNDVKIAMGIIGELGADWKSNLSTLENLSKTSTRDYLDRYEIQYDNLKKEDDIAKAAKYGQLPKFLGGIDWKSGTTQTTQTSSGISPEIDAMLKELGIN